MLVLDGRLELQNPTPLFQESAGFDNLSSREGQFEYLQSPPYSGVLGK